MMPERFQPMKRTVCLRFPWCLFCFWFLRIGLMRDCQGRRVKHCHVLTMNYPYCLCLPSLSPSGLPPCADSPAPAFFDTSVESFVRLRCCWSNQIGLHGFKQALFDWPFSFVCFRTLMTEAPPRVSCKLNTGQCLLFSLPSWSVLWHQPHCISFLIVFCTFVFILQIPRCSSKFAGPILLPTVLQSASCMFLTSEKYWNGLITYWRLPPWSWSCLFDSYSLNINPLGRFQYWLLTYRFEQVNRSHQETYPSWRHDAYLAIRICPPCQLG